MTDPASYECVFAAEVLASFLQMPPRRQRQIARLALQLARHPHNRGDYSTRDDQGRAVEHLLLGDFVFSYWTDHAAREVRIVEIEDAS